MIVLASVIGAIVVAAATVGPELLEARRFDFGSILLPRLSMLAVAALAASYFPARRATEVTPMTTPIVVHRAHGPGARSAAPASP